MLLGFAAFVQDWEPGPGWGPWGWYCNNDLSAAARTQGPTGSNAEQPAELHRNSMTFSCNLLACLVNGTLRIHLRSSFLFEEFPASQGRSKCQSKTQSAATMLNLGAHSSACPVLSPTSLPQHTHSFTCLGTWIQTSAWAAPLEDVLRNQPVRCPVLQVPS